MQDRPPLGSRSMIALEAKEPCHCRVVSNGTGCCLASIRFMFEHDRFAFP